MIEPRVITTSDGLALEAELSLPETAPRAAMVMCHPHPQFGGTMRSIVIGALFEALPRVGVICLRFNFRGVEGARVPTTTGTASNATHRPRSRHSSRSWTAPAGPCR